MEADSNFEQQPTDLNPFEEPIAEPIYEANTSHEEEVFSAREKEFLQILLSIESQQLNTNSSDQSSVVFNFLHEWLISYSNFANDKELESQMDLFPVYLHLLDRYPPQQQSQELKRMNRLISSWSVLKLYCCRQQWTKRTLEVLIPKLLGFFNAPNQTNEFLGKDIDSILVEAAVLVENLGSFTIHESELKSLFRLFQKTKKMKQRVWPLLLDSLKRISASPSTPNIYFYFPGMADSGLSLPPLAKFPPNGFSFCTWIRIEAFAHPHIKPYQPHVFSFTSNEGTSIDLLFSEGNLHLRYDIKGKREMKKLNYAFIPQQWYFVAITHEYKFLGRSEVTLHVNKDYKFPTVFSYPKISEPLTQCFAGMNGKIGGKFLGGTPQPFFGQMSTFFFFEDALSPQDIQTLADIAPSHFANINPASVNTPIDARFAEKLIYGLSPKAVSNALAYNMSKTKSANATLRGIKTVKEIRLQESIRYVGGVKALFPMFAALGPSEPLKFLHERDMSSDSIEDAQLSTDASLSLSSGGKSATSILFSLMNELLRHHNVNQQDFADSHGFQVLSNILLKLSPQTIGRDTVDSLFKLGECIATNELLERELYTGILLNFKIWIYTDYEVQQDLLNGLSKLYNAKPDYFRLKTDFGVQYFFDILRQYYWFQPESFSMAVEPLVFLSDGITLVGRRPSAKQTRELRHAILEIVFALIKENITTEEVKSIVNYLVDCNDHRQLVDIMQLILSLQKKANHNILKQFQQENGIDVLIRVLQNENESCRLWTLKVLTKVLEQTPKTKDPPLNYNRAIGIKKRIQQFSLTQSTYYSLLELLLELASITSVKHPLQEMLSTGSQAVPTFKNIQVIPIIFEIACLGASLDLQEQVLQDFLYLLKYSPPNRTLFIEQQWQSWLFGMLANESKAATTYVGTLKTMIIDVFALLLHHSLLIPDGYNQYMEMETLLEHFQNQGFLDGYKLRRSIMEKLLSSTKRSFYIKFQCYPNPRCSK